MIDTLIKSFSSALFLGILLLVNFVELQNKASDRAILIYFFFVIYKVEKYL